MYTNEGSGFFIPGDVYQGLESLWIEDFADDQVNHPKFAVEALADLTGPDSGTHAIFVAVDTAGNAVGTCFATNDTGIWILDGAFVTKNRREEKIFSAIMRKVKAEAQLQGITELVADPSARAPKYWRPALGRWGFTVKEDDPDTLINRPAFENR